MPRIFMITNRRCFVFLLYPKLVVMLLFAVPLYLIGFLGWLIYAGFIKKNLKQNLSMVYFGGVFTLIWVVILLISF